MSDTQPIKLSDTQPSASSIGDTQPRKVKPKGFQLWIVLLVIVGAIALGAFGGYNSGIGARVSAQKTNVAQSLSEQLALAQQDFEAGFYANARGRLEYILKQDPSFPGAAEKLTDVMVKMAITPSPTPTLVPTLTPTPDLRSQEAIFAQAQQHLQNKDWANALAVLDALRKADSTYKTAQVDSMYYTALRNRGVDQIMGTGASQQTNLEGGIYDLTLAERFGPLDGLSDGLRNFARLYIIGASFWDLDWAQAKDYFAQVYQFTPNLRDASGVTATERYRYTLLKYGDLQTNANKLDNRCAALDTWQQAANISPLDAEYVKKFNELNYECNPPTEVPTVEPTPTP
ncbi:MAG: hypothetical protein EHM81_14880 [Chloroflexi bacterium]|nr:MAG: hypothetical protein EHM81_14880 [Chloroflexota bacterium]